MTRNERFEGTPAERAYVERNLARQRLQGAWRQSKPTLADLLLSDNPVIDAAQFCTIADKARTHFRKLSDVFNLIAPERYAVLPTPSGDIGGFFGAAEGGYNPYTDIGFMSVLNPGPFPDRALRTAEAARNYIHDSFHASSFRTFRAGGKPGQAVYRYQYGFNFRNRFGISYSSPALTAKGPRQINLNILMEGITHIAASRFMAAHVSVGHQETPRERAVAQELMSARLDEDGLPQAKGFFDDIMRPTEKFLAYWGGETQLLPKSLTAMLTGDIAPLAAHFAARTGNAHAWEALFRQQAYRPPVEAVPAFKL